MARMLSIEDFGIMNTLFAIFTICVVPMGTISIVIAKYIAKYRAYNDEYKANSFISFLSRYVFIASIIIIILLLPISFYINKIYSINDIQVCILLAITIGTNIFILFMIGVFQGYKMFFLLGIFNVLVSIIKLIVSIWLVIVGYGVKGIIISLLISNVIGIILTVLIIIKTDKNIEKIKIDSLKIILNYVLSVTIANVILSYFTNIDMLVVKKYFSIQEAGLYSTSILFSKFVLYLPTTIGTVLFPFVVEDNETKKINFSIIKKPLIYTIIYSLSVYIFMHFCGYEIIRIMFGDKFSTAYIYTQAVLIMAIPMGIYILLMNFCLAINYTKMFLCSGIFGCISYYILASFLHNNVLQIVWLIIFIVSIIILINIISLYIKYSSKNT